ncbi:MAG: TRAP transporter large permease subunit [Deltaproteobacteria bacterium]|nr:TRAP transporter large permease subunit [Deltaproteobacteria bacterium]MBW1928679.1 TRAP transporter large permease subunit [Deltaproteobacteria bacterium]MBW2026370.1 TRAP transporter large permease subunit [Deltaproteobacteria bacterium]MBW2126357.1 TRAP transporter large permease subunit [Deltaproteobacteria bacterium]
MSGSSLATAALFGTIALPEMKRLRYSDKLATGCIAAGGTLGSTGQN